MTNRTMLTLAGFGLTTAALFTIGCRGGSCGSGACSVPAHSNSTYSAPVQGSDEVIVQESPGSSFAPAPMMQGSGSR